MSMQNLMAGVTAALLIGTGAAWAQTGTDTQGQAGGQGQVQQTAPAQQGGTQTGTETQTGAGAGTEAQTGTQTDTQTGTETQTDTQTGTQTQQGQTQTEAETGSEAGTDAEQQTDTQQTQQQTQETNVDIDITTEQETTIKSEISEIDVDPIEVDFDVAIGVSVPGTIVLHPLPTVIIDVVPDFAGFLFFILVDGRIAIVHPDTHVVVAVI